MAVSDATQYRGMNLFVTPHNNPPHDPRLICPTEKHTVILDATYLVWFCGRIPTQNANRGWG